MENNTPLHEPTYMQAQAALKDFLAQAEQSGADQLTLAHALAPIAIKMLLKFHPAETVGAILTKQVEMLDAMISANEGAKH